MRTGRFVEIRSELLTVRCLWLPATIVAVGLLLLFSAVAWRISEQGANDALRTEWRKAASDVGVLSREKSQAPALQAALKNLTGRFGRKEDLRKVFDPIVSPAKDTGVETRDVSYQSTDLDGVGKVYSIRFVASGTYVSLARFMARLEAGSPLIVIDKVDLAPVKAEAPIVADVAATVVVR